MRTYKIRTLPNLDQRAELERIFEVARIAYNFANKRVKERVVEKMSVLKAANFQTLRNEWNAGVRDTHPCTRGIVRTYACGAIQQLATAYKSNETVRARCPQHEYVVSDRDLRLTPTETLVI